MKTTDRLPEGYGEIFSVNLQRDKKVALILNVSAFAIMIILAFIGALFVPISLSITLDTEIWLYLLKLLIAALGIFAYIILHELTHGVAMKLYGAKKIKYGITLLYAYAGSENDYFGKISYLVIALAPVVFWGAVLGIICAVVPPSWFWVVYVIQIMNLSGAMGDLYVTFKFIRFPSDILVRDTGFEMQVFSKKEEIN